MALDARAYLDMCYVVAKNSPCVKAKVGAIVVDSDGIICGMGYNHSPNPAFNDCAKQCAGDLRDGVPSGTCLELCYAVHAEQWAIHEAGRFAKHGTLYVASFDSEGNKRLKDNKLPLGHPLRGFYCSMCARAIWMAGISTVVVDGISGPLVNTPEWVWDSAYEYAAEKSI